MSKSVRRAILLLLAALVAAAANAADPPVERISFKEAVDRALARNPTVQEAAAEVLRAEALVQQARASTLPTLTGNAQYTRLDSARRFGSQIFTPQGVTTANGTLSVPLVDLAAWAAWAHSLDSRKIAELSAVDVKRRVAVAAANAFLTVIARHLTLEANQRALDTARAHLDVAHQRQVGGLASRLEEVQAVQEASNDEVRVAQSALDVRRAQEALGVLVAVDGALDAADVPVFEGLGPGTPEDAALDARADVQLQALRQRAAERVLRDSWRDSAPTLDLVLQELLQSPSTLIQPANSWQALLQLTVPIYDGGLRRGRTRERQALVEEAQANLAGVKIQARSDVRTAAAAIQLADEQLASARNAARQAEDALAISNLSYKAGASTSLDVLDSERRLRDAETAVATAEDAARQARLDLLVASGRFP
ncbi:MAG TPA: TolC family protein [Thermoanaerobaculia bacterium]|nr:TolC family protein [Thermoanaerobaculia bacterium]